MKTIELSVFQEMQMPQDKSDFTGYEFDGIPDLFADKVGNFWYKGNRIEKQYRERQIYLLIDGKIIGIVTLRKLARKTTQDFMPF